MRNWLGALVGVTLAVSMVPGAGAQPQPPRTPWGAPDLRGIWNHATATPLERPERHAGREWLTEAEVAEVDAEARSTEGVGARRTVWWERPLSDRRTALITSPPSGRIPYTDDARVRLSVMPELGVDAPEDRSPQERCLTYGIPRLGGPYSANIHIAQTPDHVLLLFEMVHEFRVIPLDGAPHLPSTIRQWLGDSRGRWEGDSLVVETTNFREQQLFQQLPLDGTRLVERFTRMGGALRYEVSFDDPALWAQPWTARLDMASTEGPMFEYACHEGNVGLTAILEIARGDPPAGVAR